MLGGCLFHFYDVLMEYTGIWYDPAGIIQIKLVAISHLVRTQKNFVAANIAAIILSRSVCSDPNTKVRSRIQENASKFLTWKMWNSLNRN